ncbi:MAG: hypothetical protein ACKVUS_05375 [Saprospiraceae bacterium]
MSFLRRYYLPILFALLVPVALNRWEKNLRGVIWSDTEGYYMYLPAAFIIQDFHKVPEGSMNARKNAQGEVVMKYTCGVALFHAPFFFAARAAGAALGKHDPDDYFNKDYCRAIGLSGLFFGFLGLFFLRKSLLKTYSEAAVALAILAMLFGTNLFHYITKESGLSHGYSFCLFAFMAWQTPRFLKSPTWANALLVGGALGWITLIRPTNLMVALLPLLWDVYSWKALKERTSWLIGQWPKLLGALGAMFVFFLPQMFYWHEMTGQWLLYSYEGESFIYWDKPKIADVLFDVQNGLLLYSPIVALALIGIGMGWREKRHHAPLMTLLFVLATYLFASWWAWWFGGAFGHRCYVEFYALLIFPMAGFFEKTLALRSPALKWGILALAVFLMYYGVKMSFLYNQLPGPWDGADWRWNPEKIKWVWSHLFKV